MRVLVIEDDGELAEAIAAGLRLEGMAVDTALDGDSGLERALVNDYDVIALDRDLPGVHGDAVCAKLAGAVRARILMLTAAGTIEDRVTGLDRGADDYLPKPFAFAELVARIRALARRSHPAVPPVLTTRGITLDPARRRATRHGTDLDLGPKELAVLELLMAAGGRVVSAEELLERGWDEMADPFSTAVKVTVQPAAPQARRSPRDRDRRAGRVPDMRRGSVRLRLTLLFGSLFLAAGAALLGITYGLVSHATNDILVARQVAGSGTASPTTLPDLGQVQAQAAQTAGQARAAEDNALLLYSGIALAIMAVASVALGWFAAGHALRPLRRITAAARRISATSLHERLALDGPDDDLRELADVIDDLFGRLDASFDAQRQFVANASHELRTPLARSRTLLEVALRSPDATAGSLRAACERVLAAGEEQERLIEALLTLARGQRGIGHREPLDLAAITRDVLAARGTEVAARGLAMAVTLAPALMAGDLALSERAVANLIDNALLHNVADGTVWVTVGTDDGRAMLTVANTGPVIPPGAADWLLIPFHRGGAGAPRATRSDGLGLGLPIVRAIAAAHGASFRITPRSADGGLTARLVFPPVPWRPAAFPIAFPGG